MPPKRRNLGPQKPASSLDARQRALAEEERLISAEMQRIHKVIEEAPKVAEERARRQREEIITRASRTEQRPGRGVALPDRRYTGLNVAVPVPGKRLRRERRQGRLTFFFLLIVLIVVMVWVYFSFTNS